MILCRPFHLEPRICTEEFAIRQCRPSCPLFHGIECRDDVDYNSDGDTPDEAEEMFHILYAANKSGVLYAPEVCPLN